MVKQWARKGLSGIVLMTLLPMGGFAWTRDAGVVAESTNAYLALVLHKTDVFVKGTKLPVKIVKSADAWMYVLVNREHPLPSDFAVTEAATNNGKTFDARAVGALNAMIQGAKADGVSLIVGSGYRSIERQQYLFDRKIKQYMAKGYDYQAAYDIAKTIVAIPGTSEHNTGLAADIVTPSYQTLDEGFEKTDAFAWLSAHCAEYGFILRFPKGKEAVTGIIYEPWHYRYVGVEAAQEIMSQGLTLEEYWAQNEIVVKD